MARGGFDGLPVVDESGVLVGIVTSWDLAISIGSGCRTVAEIMTRKVITADEGEPVESVARKLEEHGISGVPVVDSGRRVIGIITTDDISKLFGRR